MNRRTSVLLAEDNGELRRVLKLALEGRGYQVSVASNGAEAIALQAQAPADILLTDLFMPGMDGFEAIQAFRRDYPDTRIVAMSGPGQRVKKEYLSSAELIGVDATLRKPFGVDELLKLLDEVLRSASP